MNPNPGNMIEHHMPNIVIDKQTNNQITKIICSSQLYVEVLHEHYLVSNSLSHGQMISK